MKRYLAATLLCLVAPSQFASAGLFGDVEFIPYEGSQHWKVGSGGLVQHRDGMTIFYGMPSRPYMVLGAIEVRNWGRFTNQSTAMGDVVRTARKHGADAVAVLTRGEDGAQAIALKLKKAR